jgi:AraC-like DNA-binding protein
MPFRSLLNMLRIKDAKRLLAKSDMNHYSIEGISSMVGYRNLSTFNRNFKNETGLTPSYFQSRSQTILKKTSR